MDLLTGSLLSQFPAKKAVGIVSVILHIAACGHVENDATLAVLLEPFPSELQAELRFANARCSDNNSKLSWQEPSAQHVVQLRDSGKQSIRHESLSLCANAAGQTGESGLNDA
jgi:hypothetical protein